MDKKAKDFLLRILQTPSPSGYERPLQREVRRYLDGIAEKIEIDGDYFVELAKLFNLINGIRKHMLNSVLDNIYFYVED